MNLQSHRVEGDDSRNKILVINPGSTSTKVAVYGINSCEKETNLVHSAEELREFGSLIQQLPYRMQGVISWMDASAVAMKQLWCVVGRGGLLRPLPGGTYTISDLMVEELAFRPQADHASNLGALMARSIAEGEGIPSFIVDPVSVDEFDPLSRLSGLPELPRRCQSHALNMKAVAWDIAEHLGKPIQETAFIVAHLGGGISVAALQKGRIIDVNNANEGGPFSPERSGSLPAGELIKMAYSGAYSFEELKKRINGQGGMIAYLSTNDARVVADRIKEGDSRAQMILEAMAYQIAKEIGAMATVLKGQLDGIILTGGLAYSKNLTRWIIQRVQFLAEVYIHEGSFEMEALWKGALRVLEGHEVAKIYEQEVLEL